MILGVAFTLLFTRRVSVEDYSVWVMISKYVAYLVLPSVVYTNWIPRDISRGKNTSKTGLYSSVIFGIFALPLYTFLIFEASNNLNQPLIPLLISILILPLEYLNTILSSIANGYAPQRSGYASFSLKVGQIASGYLLLGFLTMGLTGAVISIVIGKLCSVILGLYLNSGVLKKSKFSLETLKTWLRASWLHTISILYALVFSLDVIVVRVFYGDGIPVAYYGLCMSIVSLALFANVVSSTVYPRIISKRNLDDLKDSVWLTLLLCMPVFFVLQFFADPVCALFGIEYLPMANALRIFAFSAIIQALLGLITAAYIGLDRFDENTLTTNALYKSTLFKSNVLILFINCSYLLLLIVFSQINASPQQFIEIWSLAFTLCFVFQLALFSYMLKRDHGVLFPFSALVKSILTFTIPAIPLVIISMYWDVSIDISFYAMLQNMAPPVIISLLLYLTILFGISSKFRTIIRTILHTFASTS